MIINKRSTLRDYILDNYSNIQQTETPYLTYYRGDDGINFFISDVKYDTSTPLKKSDRQESINFNMIKLMTEADIISLNLKNKGIIED